MNKLSWIENLVFVFVGLVVSFIMISTFFWVNNDGIELFSVTSPLIFPFLIGVTMFICLVSAIVVDRKTKNKANSNEESSKEFINDIKKTIVYSIGVVVYAFVIKRVGFMIGTILFLIIGMVFMNYEELGIGKKVIKATLVSCVAVPLLYFVFYKIFHVMLP